MMEVVSHPDPEYPNQRRHDHLWLLAGGAPRYQDEATAYYLGPDRDIDGDDLAGRELTKVIQKHKLDAEAASQSLSNYRSYVKG